jgi:hypothetical protein
VAWGVNPPHYHPRASETALILAGRVYSGFVDSGSLIFATVLDKGEVMVFPKGMNAYGLILHHDGLFFPPCPALTCSLGYYGVPSVAI